MASKICKKCHLPKKAGEFHVSSWGRSGTCKDCTRIDDAKRKKARKENADPYKYKSYL